MSGILSDGTHSIQREVTRTTTDAESVKCLPHQATSPSADSLGAIVVAANAGSDYLFVRDQDAKYGERRGPACKAMEFGAILVSDRDGAPRTFPMSLIMTEHSGAGRAPDIIVSFNYDENVSVAGKSGIS